MKKISLSLFVVLLAFSSLKAQKVYFVYLQTENQQPFYARMGEKIYNSTPAGYLILSNLRDSNYTMNIGMQGSQSPDQPYLVSINKKDQGFLVKNFGEKGWGLFNLTTMAVIMPSNPVSAVQAVKTEKTEDNAFTNLLAKAADDSTIKEKPVIEKKAETTAVITEKKEEPKNEVKEVSADAASEKSQVQPEKKEEPKAGQSSGNNLTPDVKNNDALKAGVIAGSTVAVVDKAGDKNKETKQADSLEKQDTVVTTKPDPVKESEYKRSTVKLKSESSTTTGIGLVFLDIISNDITDTVHIIIPPTVSQPALKEIKPEEKKFLDITSVDSTVSEPAKVAAVKTNNCKQVAIEDDFFKLRKKMVAQKNDDDMITEAKKVFKTKCFSTVQIRNLGTLFLTDEAKYKFYDSAYPYVSDTEVYPTLQTSLKDEYYINRFKAMLH